jgi:hypothetical protein
VSRRLSLYFLYLNPARCGHRAFQEVVDSCNRTGGPGYAPLVAAQWWLEPMRELCANDVSVNFDDELLDTAKLEAVNAVRLFTFLRSVLM